MKQITSRDNPQYKHWLALSSRGRDRRKTGRSLLDGTHLLTAALETQALELVGVIFADSALAQLEIAQLQQRTQSLPQTVLSDSLFRELSTVDTPTGVLTEFVIPECEQPIAAQISHSVVALDGVQDAGNLGTLIRTAAAAGIGELWLGEGCAQAWAPKVLRAGQGGHFCLPIREQLDLPQVLAELRQRSTTPVLVTGLNPQSVSLFTLPLQQPVVWLFGAEGQGVSADVAALASTTVTIPMPGAVESLNVAAAAAICLFEQVRQCNPGGGSDGA